MSASADIINFETLHKLPEGQRRIKAASERLERMKVNTSNNLFNST